MPRYAMRDNALIIEIDGGVGDEIQFTKHDDGTVSIEIDEPWAGSTETGFGATTSCDLKPEDLEVLLKWLKKK